MTETIKPPIRVGLVDGDDNARVLVDANDNIICLTNKELCDRLADAMNVGLARIAVC